MDVVLNPMTAVASLVVAGLTAEVQSALPGSPVVLDDATRASSVRAMRLRVAVALEAAARLAQPSDVRSAARSLGQSVRA